jgi:adenylosuccinate lyase
MMRWSSHGLEAGRGFEESLAANGKISAAFTAKELRELLDPTTYVGYAPEIVSGVLKNVEKNSWPEA